MILIDANLLVYAYIEEMPHHKKARAWLDDTLATSPRVGLPWVSLMAFLRIVTNRRLFQRPPTMKTAWGQVQRWLDADSVWIPQPTERHRTVLDSLLGEIGGKPELVTDAHLAAIAVEHGLVLCSSDGDFARFSQLRWLDPLSGRSKK